MTKLGTGRAAAITPAEMAALADELGCHPADLEAIAIVESGGFGWYRDGRMKILWEYHWFYKLVVKALRALAVKAGLARAKWISPAKGGYRGQNTPDQRYDLLKRGMEMDEPAALQSISMGRFQIMGFNWKTCGFASVRAMWDAFLDSERNQVSALANFLRKNGLAPALRARNFHKIEKGYNGGGLKGAYARRMKAESNKLRAGKWKDYTPGKLGPVPARPPVADPDIDPVTGESSEGARPPIPRPRPEPADQVADEAEVVTLPPLPPAPVEEQPEPNAFVVFLLNLLARFSPFARTNWTPVSDADERDAGD